MEGNVTMMARDAINAKLAECYITIPGTGTDTVQTA